MILSPHWSLVLHCRLTASLQASFSTQRQLDLMIDSEMIISFLSGRAPFSSLLLVKRKIKISHFPAVIDSCQIVRRCLEGVQITEHDLGTVWESGEEGWCFSATSSYSSFLQQDESACFFQLSLRSRLQWACIASQGQQHFISAQQNDRKPRMAERPQTRDDWEPTMNLWRCMFYFSLLGRKSHLWEKKTIPCVCFRPQQPWTVK